MAEQVKAEYLGLYCGYDPQGYLLNQGIEIRLYPEDGDAVAILAIGKNMVEADNYEITEDRITSRLTGAYYLKQ